MMQYVKQDVSSSYGETLSDDSKAQFGLHFQLVYTSTRDQRAHGNSGDYGGAYGVVGIFEVKY